MRTEHGHRRAHTGRMLIAGVGNIFFGDDGFGVEVIRRLTSYELPEWVRLADFGIRGIHLAYELLEDGYEKALLVDAAPRGGIPGTVYVLALDPEDPGLRHPVMPDTHSMDPHAVLALLRCIGGPPPRMWLVGCEPARTGEEIGLSKPVQQAVDEAVTLILGFVKEDERARK